MIKVLQRVFFSFHFNILLLCECVIATDKVVFKWLWWGKKITHCHNGMRNVLKGIFFLSRLAHHNAVHTAYSLAHPSAHTILQFGFFSTFYLLPCAAFAFIQLSTIIKPKYKNNRKKESEANQVEKSELFSIRLS